MMTVVISAGGQPEEYRCKVPPGVLINESSTGNESLTCEINVGNNDTQPCTEWEYFGDVGHTIVTQVTRAPAIT